MDWQSVYVILLAVATIVLLAFEKAHLSTIGVGLMVATSFVLPNAHQAVAGLSNTAVVTIAALYIVGEAFLRSGAASLVAKFIMRHTGDSESLLVFWIMVAAAILSAFVNNTLVVITFLPVITSICQKTGLYPSRLLIPLSYASILGGMCTLVGTSTNLLVSGSLEAMGQPGLGMFEMSPAGLILATVGILFLTLVGRRLLPKIPSLSGQMAPETLREYVMEITVAPGSKLLGMRTADVAKLAPDAKLRVTMMVRNEITRWPPFGDATIEAGDMLMLTGPIQALTELQRAESRGDDAEGDRYDPSTMSFFELALRPDAAWVGRSIGEVALKRRYGAVVVAIQRGGQHIRDRLATMTLQSGDVLLAFGDERSKTGLRRVSDFHLIEGIDKSIFLTEKAPVAFAVILGVIALLVTGVVHYSTAAMLGALGATATRCLTIRQAHYAVNWPIIMFLAGTLALGQAMQATGTTQKIAGLIEQSVGGMGPHALVATLMIGAVVLTETLSNNAVAVLLTPIAITTAQFAGVEARPLVLAVALGASCSFATPMGYKTNLLVYGPGGYRFRDYLRAGIGLDLLLVAVGILVIPWLWPLG